ncbi:TadG family pilus assembly protein [Celeribacter ethanolicus]|uniref:TadG family pilus assembly protein n=1 Tax=Celeribacter ethanolicus TaxID=1758178 RepID=UPI000A4B9A58|nr:TadG family pilus assembly protein [Celeribacter ethanolicus]
MPIKRHVQRFHRDERGAVAIVVALFMTVAIGFLALGVDLGSLYFEQKTLQTRADMAAVSAVLNLDDSPAQNAQDTVAGNALAVADLETLSYGRYLYDAAVSPEARFTVGDLTDTGTNAAEVVLTDDAPLYFSSLFLGTNSTPLSASATAARFDFASFSLGSRLLSLDEGLLNALLEELLGTSLSLTALDYEALANTNIDLLTFTDALANRIDLTAASYEDILTSDIDLLDVAGALLDTGLVSGSTDVLTAILNGVVSSTLNASQLIAIDGDNVALQLEDVLREVSVSALDILMTSVEILNQDHYIEASLDLDIPGVLDTDLGLIVGARKAGSGWITLGDRGATVHTAQVRLKLLLDLSPSLLEGIGEGVSVLSLRLPLYAEIASATATLADLNCDAGDADDVVARFDTGFAPMTGTTGNHVLELFLGEFDAPTFEDTTTPLDADLLEPAKFLDLELSLLLITIDLFSLNIKSHVATGISEQPETEFRVSQIGETQTYGVEGVLSSTVASLLDPDNLEISVSNDSQSLLGGLLELLLAPVVALVNLILTTLPNMLLTALLTPIDAVLDALFNLLGIGIGEADLTLEGVSCGKVMLVR